MLQGVCVAMALLSVVACSGRRPARLAPASLHGARLLDTRKPEAVSDVAAPDPLIQPDYILAPEDVVDINVWRNEALTRTVFIRPDGKISLPLIGDVQAAGFTPDQLRETISERLKAYKEMPEVAVVVREIGSFSVYVMGEVHRPGKFQLRSDTTLLQLVALVGGFTPFADSNKILLLRREGDYETRMRIRYKDIVSGKNPAGNVILKRGDTIVVP